jgi:hypothetical protein
MKAGRSWIFSSRLPAFMFQCDHSPLVSDDLPPDRCLPARAHPAAVNPESTLENSAGRSMSQSWLPSGEM